MGSAAVADLQMAEIRGILVLRAEQLRFRVSCEPTMLELLVLKLLSGFLVDLGARLVLEDGFNHLFLFHSAD